MTDLSYPGQQPTTGPGTVLFVDDGWDCFFQLAALVRRAGFRAVRVTIGVRGRAETTWNLIFHRIVVLPSASDIPTLGTILAGERVIDIQCVDSLTRSVVETLWSSTNFQKGGTWDPLARATDKIHVAKVLPAHGILVPEIILAADASPDEAATRLGLPVLLKPRSGSGGLGVAIANTLEELRMMAIRQENDWFYEQYIFGRQFQVACLANMHGTRAAVTYETIARTFDFGPATVISTTDDDDLLQLGAATINALGLSGFVNINVIRDADGRDWVHDVNPRVWGSFLVFRAIGVDFAHAYLEWLEDPERCGTGRRAVPGVRAAVIPAAIRSSFSQYGMRGVGRLARDSWPYIRVLGTRYFVFEIVRQILMFGQPAKVHQLDSDREGGGISRS